MKNILPLLLVFLASGSFEAFAVTKTISGSLLDNSNNPVANHAVIVYYDSTGVPGSYSQYTAYTNNQGNYSATVNVAQAVGVIFAYTTDCYSNLIQNQINYTAATSYSNIDFVYCNITSSIAASIAVDSSSTPYVLTANEINGIGPFQYAWSTGETTQSISVSSNAVYCVTITDVTNTAASDCRSVYLDCTASFDHSPVGTTVTFQEQLEGYQPFTLNWTLGDGNSTAGSNPSHTYTASQIEPFNVCLTATDAANCIINYCNNVVVSPNGGDYTVSGNLMTGSAPVQGAKAYLFAERANNPGAIFEVVDSLQATSSQTYSFSHLPEGEYLIQAALPPSHTEYNQFASTYFGNHVSWQMATSLLLQNNSSNNNIMLRNILYTAGIGSIEGVIRDSATQNGVANIPYYVIDSNGSIRARSFSNQNGVYSLHNLPLGDYELWLDFAGKHAQPYAFSITSTSVSYTNIDWEVKENQVAPPDPDTGINNREAYEMTLFPNPASNHIQITGIDSKFKTITVVDLAGRLVHTDNSVNFMETIDVSNWEKGFYVLLFETDSGTELTKRLIVR